MLAWHDALNAADIDTLAALSSDDIEIGDAHGAAQGHEALRTWASSGRATTELGEMYVHDGVVVAELTGDTPMRPPTPRWRSGSSTTTSLRCSVTRTWRRRWQPPNSPGPTSLPRA